MKKYRIIAALLGALALLALPGVAAAKSRDRDHDRMPDRWERRHHLAVGKHDGARDPDGDGLANLGEFRSHTDPSDIDTDHDGVEDGDEDGDRDRVDNANELAEHTSPTDRDSDDDGIRDGAEDADHDGLSNAAEDRTGNDPDDEDTDDDGTEDGDERAGAIASFAGGVLSLRLADGSVVSGLVTSGTEISCETEDEHEDEAEGEDEIATQASSDEDGDAADDVAEDSSDDEDVEFERERVGDEDNVCGAADLAVGVLVHEAELELTSAGATFVEIELLK